MKNKKLLIIPIVLIILLVLGTGLGASLYFFTDIFKSPKQLFFKYLGEAVESDKDFDYDKFLAEYKEKTEKSYTSTGEITGSFDLNYDESLLQSETSSNSSTSTNLSDMLSTMDNVKQALDKSKIEYSEEAIPSKNKYHMNIKPIYNGNEVTNLELLTSDDNYGIKCSDLYDKYVYVQNNNLKALASKFGINSSTIPDKIEKTDPYELLYIAPETRKQISDKYRKIFR